jgi:hypothetical protein
VGDSQQQGILIPALSVQIEGDAMKQKTEAERWMDIYASCAFGATGAAAVILAVEQNTIHSFVNLGIAVMVIGFVALSRANAKKAIGGLRDQIESFTIPDTDGAARE